MPPVIIDGRHCSGIPNLPGYVLAQNLHDLSAVLVIYLPSYYLLVTAKFRYLSDNSF